MFYYKFMRERNSSFPGFFVTFEGIDGAGKSTHLDFFQECLRSRFPEKKIVMTREPGGTELGEKLRQLLLHQEMHAETEALLMFAARREHLAVVIEPALACGQIVICDRYTDSSFAYQVGGRGILAHKLNQLESWTIDREFNLTTVAIQPNLTILFDISPEEAEKRRALSRNPDKFEALNFDFFNRVRAEYLRRVKEDPMRFEVIDASQSIKNIQKVIGNIATKIELYI